MRYVADDGTEFDNEKECLEYESILMTLRNVLFYTAKN